MKTTYNPPSLVTALLSVLVCVVLGCPGMAAGNPVRWSVPCDSVSTEMSDTLPELTVTRRLAERNGLTDSFVVDKALRANTHEAADIIGKLPGFHYNPLDKALTYLGSGNVIVLVDSMAKDESYIKRMNPSRIVRVSVTNFPGGKYADYDAVVNLVTARDYDGNDMVALSEATMSTGGGNGRGHPLSGLREVLEYTHTHNSWNIAFSGSYSRLRNGQGIGLERTFVDNDYTERTPLPSLGRPNRIVTQSRGAASLWVDRTVAPGHTLSLGMGLSPASGGVAQHSTLVSGRMGHPGDTVMQDTDDRQRGFKEYRITTQYVGGFRGWSVDAVIGYTSTAFDRLYSLTRPGFGIADNRHVRSKYTWGGGGVTRPMLESRLTLSLSDYVTWIDYRERELDTRTVLSTTDELRNRLSASMQYSPSWRWSVGASVGANITHSSVSGLSRTRVTSRVTANAMWSSQKVMVRLNYMTGAEYPSLSMQQDFGAFHDSLVYMTSNPLLAPAVSHQGRAMVNIVRHLTIGADYTYTRNAVFSIAGMDCEVRPDGIDGPFLSCMYRNGRSWAWNASVTYNNTFRGCLSLSVTASLQGRRAMLSGTGHSKTLPRYDWYVSYTSSRLGLQVYLSSALHSAMSVTPQETAWGLYDGYTVAAVKFLFKSRLQLTGRWRMPVHFIRRLYRSHMGTGGYSATMVEDTYRRNDNTLSLTAVWRFSNGDKTRKINRQTESVEIM